MPEPRHYRFPMTFADAEVELGRTFVAEGKVELSRPDKPDFHEAEVRHFGRSFWVWMRTKDGRDVIGHGCDCSHYENTGLGCEHLWALVAVLEGDEDSAAQSEGLLPIYLLHTAECEKESRLVVSIFRPDGVRVIMDHSAWALINHDADVEVLRVLADKTGGWVPVKSGGGFVAREGPWRPKDAESRIFRGLVATGRLYAGASFERRTGPLAESDGTATLALRIQTPTPNDAELQGVLLLPDKTLFPLEKVDGVVTGALKIALIGSQVFRVETHDTDEWVRRTRRGPPSRFPRDGVLRVLSDLARTHPLPRLVLDPSSVPVPLEQRSPVARVGIFRKGSRAVLELDFVYGEGVLINGGARGLLALDPAGPTQVERNLTLESRWIKILLDADVEQDEDQPGRFHTSTSRLGSLVDQLAAAGFLLVLEDKRTRRAGILKFSLRGGHEWFEIDGTLEADGRSASLLSVLAAMKSERDYIELHDGSAAILSAEDRKRLENLLRLLPEVHDSGGSLRCDMARALLVDGVLGTKNVERDESFQDLRRRLESFGGVKAIPAPSGLAAELRPYQMEGLAWTAFLDDVGLSGCLADEMGLGKTMQILATILRRNEQNPERPHLVVVPRSLVPNWLSEFQKFAPGITVQTYSGATRDLSGVAGGHVILTTYGIVRRDVDDLATQDFDYLILDEAQAIKNSDSQAALSLRRLKARRRLALTGTPIENSTDELWSILEFLNPGLFGGRAEFSEMAEGEDPVLQAALRRAIRPVLLRRTKDLVGKDLPDLIEQIVVCEMSEEQEQIYRRLQAAAAAERRGLNAGSRDASHILEALLRLRQIACHPALAGVETDSSGKIDLLMERLEEIRASGRKALVFSQFTRLLALVKKRLEVLKYRHAYLDGSTSDRAWPVRSFQEDPRCSAFLISLRAGGFGLNLTAADYVFILDPWWNPAVEAQAIARAHRIGRKSHVVAQRLVSRGTVEEAMLELQKKKAHLAATFTEETGELAGISSDELVSLLSFSGSRD